MSGSKVCIFYVIVQLGSVVYACSYTCLRLKFIGCLFARVSGTRNENRGKLRNESNASSSEKTKLSQQQHTLQQENINDAFGAKRDQRNQGNT